jgi:ketosteroid isomerase-like protein
MKRVIYTLLCIHTVIFSFGQDIEKEINEQLWKPFLKASTEFDGDGFMALQSKDLIRISLDRKDIHGYAPYEEGIIPGFKRVKSEGKVSRTTEVRFTDRILSQDLAYETGYFKSRTTLADGRLRISYTKFFFILRKENNAWRILVDSDSNEGGSITEEMFLAAKPLE